MKRYGASVFEVDEEGVHPIALHSDKNNPAGTREEKICRKQSGERKEKTQGS